MTSPNDLKLGFAVPIFANPGVVDVRTPSFVELEWAPILNGVIEAEKLGYDSLWVADHMFLGRDGAILESWTTLSALAGATSTIRLGNIHLGNGFRPPALTAKMISTLDFISGGRFDLFIDPGWREREHTAYGYQWEPDRSIRARQVGEAVELFKAMWTGDPTNFAGEFYRVDGAINTPAPTRAGGPEITIGEAFDDATLDLVARHADCWNSMPAGVDVLAQKIAAVDQACSQRGRDPATLRKTLETQVLILDDSTQWDDWLEKWSTMLGDHPVGDAMTDFFEFVHAGNPQLAEGVNSDRLREEFVIGTRAEVAEKLAAYHDLGISEVICWFMDFPSGESMRALARDVRPTIGANHG
jgi:alkanesulfonate monooxygenase SsuD/methylene tetrahydromethanopterin reductase-like flavin-dependent oxidoreductase (luciferase family)